MSRIASFPPVILQNSKILILGSVPGMKSLEMSQYYAHPQNVFWKIIFELLNEPFTTDYLLRLAVLEKYGIALWDVIDTCEREGSLDSKIKNEEDNDILQLLKKYPNIKTIYCNGKKSFNNIRKLLNNEIERSIVSLPSTSPAYAMINFQQKLAQWKIILSDLEN